MGTYIKHSAQVPLKKKHIPLVPMSHRLQYSKGCDRDKENGDDDDLELPAVVYKPASSRKILKEDNSYSLPKSIERMMAPEPLIEKHDGRVHNRQANMSAVQRKLAETDITSTFSDSSLLEMTSRPEDVSVIRVKHTFNR